MIKHSLVSKSILAAGTLLIAGSAATAQEYHNTTEKIGGIWASGMPNVIIAAGADITVDGEWYLTANTITIDPAAKIGGAGTIHLMTPQTYNGGTPVATTLNAGGAMGSGTGIGCKVSIENNGTVILAGSNDLMLSSNLNFAKAGAHLILGARNVIFTSAPAGISQIQTLANAGFNNQPPDAASLQDAYIVTNGTGVVTKQGLASGSGFTYTIGRETPANNGNLSDYTPATVTNTSGAARDLNAQVKDYATSASTEGNVTKGIYRTWQITGSTAGTANVALTHNATSEGTAYNRNLAFVTQQTAPGVWSIGTPAAPTAPNYTNADNFTVPVSGASSYFSKSSDAVNSLNPFIGVSPVVYLQGAWDGTAMTTALNTMGVIPTGQPYNVAPFNYAGTESVGAIPANVTDWVLVELRNASAPATVVATRAAFVKNDGSVVDLDGTSPIYFRSVTPGNYNIAIRHRNHLGIRTGTAQTFTQDLATSYNFTTSQSQAYQDAAVSTNAAQASLAGGSFGMWGGNGASGGAGAGTVRASGAPAVNDYSAILTYLNGAAVVSGVYANTDYNLNGSVRASGAPSINDYTFLLNVLNGQATITQHQ